MGIQKRGNTWRVDVTVKGVRKTETCYSEDEAKEAEIRLKADALKTSKAEPKADSQEPWTIGQAFERCKSAVWKGKGGERNAVRNAGFAVEYFKPGTSLNDITTDRVDEWIESLKTQGNSNATINRKLAALSRMMTYAEQRHHMDKNRRPHFERQQEGVGRIRFMEPVEEAAVMKILTEWSLEDHQDACAVLIDTGLRPIELWQITGKDVVLNGKTGVVQVWDTKNEDPRAVPLTERAYDILTRRLGQLRKRTDRLFPYNNHWLEASWNKMRLRMGLNEDEEFTPYCMRHTFGTRLAKKGVPMRSIQMLMGHKTLQVTARYTNMAAVDLQDAIKRLQEKEAI
jgi:integrase